jgi:hypothetical protein
VLNFEDLAHGTLVNNQYGARGVTFTNAYIATQSSAHSPTRVLLAGNPGGEFHPGAMRINFSSGQRYVKLFAGVWFLGGLPKGTLRAFDVNGVLLATDGPRSIVEGSHTTVFQVMAASAVIRRVELLYDDGSFESIDDLEFDGQAPVPVPTTPPTVTITAPTNGQQLISNSFTVQGTVVGPQVTGATLRVQFARPPGSTVNNVFTYPLTLVGTGDTRTFSQAVTLGIGPQQVTVSAQNTAALTGTAAVSPEYMPQAIRTRFAAEGGAATFGAFAYGRDQGTFCSYAVYANGAVTMMGGVTRVVNGTIFQKWTSMPDISKYPRLSCATSDPRAALDATVQDFRQGRIYASAAAGGVFVPPIFVSAIDALGGEAAMGLPTADPIAASQAPFYVWSFQRLRRPSIALDTTIELRGSPTRLWVYRQAGDLSLYSGVPTAGAATIAESFACSSTAGPCDFSVPAPPPFAAPGSYCGDQTFSWDALAAVPAGVNPREWSWDPPEWAPIVDQYAQVPVWGVTRKVELADGDNPFAHEHVFEPCSLTISDLTSALVNEQICPSDWGLYLRPLPAWRGMVPAGLDAVKVEFERVHAQHFLVGYDDPRLGDLVFASGRFVIDCGHTPFKTEIHPPSVLAKMRTVDLNGRPATQADIWVTGFYSGDLVEFEVMPPPRPSPTATLGTTWPLGGALDMTVEYLPSSIAGNVRVRMSASRREVHVTAMGEMRWESGRGYEGRLLVYWNP